MKDNDVLQSIDTAYDESKCLLDSALLIETNEIGGNVRVPTSFMNSAFGLWLYTDGLSLAKNPLFDSMVEQHQLVYGGYSKLFHGAKENIDVSELFADFENTVKVFHEKLDEVKKEFNDDPLEPLSTNKIESKEDSLPQTNNVESVKSDKSKVQAKQISNPLSVADKGLSKTEVLLERLQNEKKMSNAVSSVSSSHSTHSQKSKTDSSEEYLSIHDELQKENQNQLELQQELIEQELVQVKDRQRLFTKTINQLDYHHLLKEKESKIAVKDCKGKLSQNSVLKKKKISDLKEIETKRENTQQEFEGMELASIEFEKTNISERAKEEEISDQLDQELKQADKDHKKIISQQAKKKKILDDLKKRVQEVERELDTLADDELEINNEQELISSKKFKAQREIEKKLVKQHQDREHYLQLEELKFQSLQRVKKQYFSTQQEILHLEHEQKNIVQGKKHSELIRLKEIKQIQGQRDIKQQMLDVLEVEYKHKKLALKKIINEQQVAQVNSVDETADEMKALFALEV